MAAAPRTLLHKHRQLSPSASVYVSPICLGTMGFGDAWAARMGTTTKEQAFALLDKFFVSGGNFIDTATAYQSQQSERYIGEWMALRGVRDQIVLSTKYTGLVTPSPSPHPLSTTTTTQSTALTPTLPTITSNLGGNGSKSLHHTLRSSLSNLRTSYIDILFLHWWDYSTSISELMNNLNDVVRSGRVLYLGISDAPAWVVSKCNEWARGKGMRGFGVYQGLWSAGCRDFEREIVPMCRAEGMGILAYGTLGQGHFQPSSVFKARKTLNEGRNVKPVSYRDVAVSAVLEKVAASKTPPTSITSIAMAYIMHKAPYVFPLIGGRKIEHLEANIEALGLGLSEEEMGLIDGAYEFEHGFPHEFLSEDHFQTGLPSKMAQGPQDVWLTKMLGDIQFVEVTKAIEPKVNSESVEVDVNAKIGK